MNPTGLLALFSNKKLHKQFKWKRSPQKGKGKSACCLHVSLRMGEAGGLLTFMNGSDPKTGYFTIPAQPCRVKINYETAGTSQSKKQCS